jgi:hypothetical protein
MSYLDTPIDATVSAYRPVDLSDEYTSYSRDQIKQMVYDLGALAKENERFRLDVGSLRKQLIECHTQISSVEKYIKECSSSGDLNDELEHVAKLLDITLVNKYDVTITVTYRGTIEIPMSENIDDYHNHIRFEFSDPFTDEWNVDIYEDDIEISYDDVNWKD